MNHVSTSITETYNDDQVLFRVALLMPTGVIVLRDWTWADIRDSDENPDFDAAAEWLIDSVKFVDSAGEPITFVGEVPDGREDDAWAFIGRGL